MSKYLVDTDWIVDVLKGQPSATKTLLDLAPRGLAVSMISYGELNEGAYYARDPSSALESLHTFLQGKEILGLTRSIAERFAIVRGKLSRHLRDQIGDLDLLIAATALDHDLTLITRNLKHFQHLAELIIYPPG